MTRKLWLQIGMLLAVLLALRFVFALWPSAPAEPPKVVYVPPSQTYGPASTIAPYVPGGIGCNNVIHEHNFGTVPDASAIINPGGSCALADFFPPPDVCFYQQSVHSSERKGPFGGCPEAIQYEGNAALDVEKIWSAGRPFTARYTLRPRGSMNK